MAVNNVHGRLGFFQHVVESWPIIMHTFHFHIYEIADAHHVLTIRRTPQYTWLAVRAMHAQTKAKMPIIESSIICFKIVEYIHTFSCVGRSRRVALVRRTIRRVVRHWFAIRVRRPFSSNALPQRSDSLSTDGHRNYGARGLQSPICNL